MTQEQEIRVKALEITLQLISALLQKGTVTPKEGLSMEQYIIELAKTFESHIKG